MVDDHDLMVAGVRALLSTHNSPARFVAGSDSVTGLLRTQRDIDVVVLDVRLHDGTHAEENVRTLEGRGLPVLLHADKGHREAAPVLARSGAHGLVWKNDPAIHLLRAIVAVSRGERWVPPNSPRPVSLTQREREVLCLYVTGMKYAETAAALDPPVSVESVKTYLSRIRKRYADAGRPASTRMELRQRALEDGLLPPE
ncbi:MAG TPA: response regulator transcription factor [Nocardioidaceae bacterium]